MKNSIRIAIILVIASAFFLSCAGVAVGAGTTSSASFASGSLTARATLPIPNSSSTLASGTYTVYVGQYDPTNPLLLTLPAAAAVYSPAQLFIAGTWQALTITYDSTTGFVNAPAFQSPFSVPGTLTMVGFIDLNRDGLLNYSTSGSLEPIGTMGNDGGTHSDTIASWVVNQSIGPVGVQF